MLFLLVFFAFCATCAGVGYLAMTSGDLNRLIYGMDYLGNACGDPHAEYKPNATTLANDASNGATWEERRFLWYPITPDVNWVDALRMGVCVRACPNFTVAARGVDFSMFDPRSGGDLYDLAARGLLQLVSTYSDPIRTYPVLVETSDVMHRCLPVEVANWANATRMLEGVREVGDRIGVSSFVMRGAAEVRASWTIFLVAGFCAVLLSLIWLYAMRFLAKVVVFLTLLGILGLLVGAGLVCYYRYSQLKDPAYVEAHGGTGPDSNWADAYKWFAVAFWVVAGVYLCLVIFMLRRILIALDIIEEAVVVVATTPSLVCLPICNTVALGLVFAWFVYVAALLKTVGTFKEAYANIDTATALAIGDLRHIAGNVSIPQLPRLPEGYANYTLPSSTTWGGSALDEAASGYNSTMAAVRELDPNRTRDFLLLYTLFGWLWTSGFVNAFCYFALAQFTAFWYWSAPGDTKSANFPTLLKSAWWGVRYHLGTLAFGSLIVAIIQFVRFLLTQCEKQLAKLTGRDMAKYVVAVAQCCLACLERVVKFVNRNAYIMTAIRGTSFCSSCCTVLELVVCNILRMATLSFLSDGICVLAKVLIVVSNCLICYGIMANTALITSVEADPSLRVTYRVGIVVLIGVLTYLVATLFISVLGAVIDTMIIAFLYDEKHNATTGTFIGPADLKRWIDRHAITPTSAEEDHQAALRSAKVVPEPAYAPPPPPPHRGGEDSATSGGTM